MSNEKAHQGSGTPLMDSAYPQPYPPSGGMGGNYPTPPAYTPGPQPYPPGPQPYPPGPQPYPPGTQPYVPGTQPTVIMSPPVAATVIVRSHITDTPAITVCPSCRQNITTRVAYTAGLLAWLIFGILCLFGCWLGCCLIPFCVDSCKDVDHFCPNCNHHVHKYKRM